MRNSAWRWGPGIVAAILTLTGTETGILQSFQALTYNILFRMRGPIEWDERVVVVEIDDESIQAIGQFPIARSYYTQFLEQLDAAEPGVVAFDIVFAEASLDDDAFAEAMNRLNRVVLAQSWDNQGFPLLPNPNLASHAISTGHVLNSPTDDGVSRSIQPYIQSVPALGLAIAQAYSLVVEAIAIPADAHSNTSFWINWPGSAQNCPSYSFVEVLRGEVPAERFQDKIVIVGVTASGNSPLFTPFDRTPPTGGVYLQAAVVSNLLQQNHLYKAGVVWNGLILILGGPALSVLSSYRGCRRRWMSWFGCCIGWNLLGLLFLKANILLPLFWPIVLVTATTGLTESIERWRANRRLQTEIERLWDTYNPDLILWKRPSVEMASIQTPHASGVTARSHDTVLKTLMNRASTPAQPIAVQRAIQLAQMAELFGRSQSLHAAIARNLSVGLIAADWDGRVWLCNPFAETLLNLKVGELLQQQLSPDWVTLEDWQGYLHQLSESGSASWEIGHNDAWFEIKVEPLFYARPPNDALTPHPNPSTPQAPSQHPTGMLLLIQDITSFKHVEAGIRSALAEALELSELRSRFVSMASHELRTPLTIMRTSVELLKLHGLTIPLEKHTKYLTKLEASIASMQKLIDDVLVLGKSDTQRLTLNPQPLAIEAFCKDLVDHLQPAESPERRIQLVLNLDREQAMFDSTLLALILNNLLSNALKYSPVGTPVHLSVVSSAEGVTFEVRDRGIGMPIDYQTHLFQEFHRAQNVGSIPGTGLGLSIVKRCVDLHGGSISLESDVGGVGTTFRVYFPHHRW